MRKVRAAGMPLLLLAAICVLARVSFQIKGVASFDFIWDVLLGVGLGTGLCLLPSLCGIYVKHHTLSSMFWVCAFVALLLIFYQYIAKVTDLHWQALRFVENPSGRARMMEGAVLGYATTFALRGHA